MTCLTTETAARIPISDWRDGITVDEVLLVRDAEVRETGSGSSFMRLRLADRSATVPAVAWEGVEDFAELAAGGGPLHVNGHFAEHPRYGAQVTVARLRAVPDAEVCWEDLLAGPARPADELEAELEALLGSIAEPHLRALMQDLLGSGTESGRAYRVAPAAKYNHHAYRAGLLEHSLQVAAMVDAAARTFAGIDRDLAVCGALLHDIGKLEAYDALPGGAELSDAGRLEGEIPLGYFRVRRAVEAQAGFPPGLAQALLHVILAHHGRLEFGSPVVPATREATLVHFMDNLSGQLGTFDRLATERHGDDPWSRYDRVLGTAAYIPPSQAASRPACGS